MASEVTIANLALGHVGISKTISSLDASTLEASVCKLFFEPARDFALADFDWPWAAQYGALDLVAGTEDEAANDDWQFAYRYPASALRFRRLTMPANRTADLPPIPWAPGRDGSGRLIYTDQTEASGLWTARITAAEEFDPLFVSMLAWKLAADIAAPLSRDPKLAISCMQVYELEKGKAQAAALNERQADPAPDAEWIAGR